MKKVMLNVKAFQETLRVGICGPASLKIVLDYYGVVKSEQELAQLTGTAKDLGTNDKDIARAAESLGFKVVTKNESDFSDCFDRFS